MSRLVLPCVLVLAVALLLPGPAAAVKRRAFVTSGTGTGDLSTWPGSAGATAHAKADAICRVHALGAGLPNWPTYRAWISTSTTDAYCHVQGSTGKKATGCGGGVLPGAGPWYLVNGISYFTGSLDELVGPDRVIYRPVILDENLDEPTQVVGIWTGTDATGAVWDDRTCADWTSGSTDDIGVRGASNRTAVGWTQATSNTCNQPARLLCLEPGVSEDPSPLGWSPGAIVFATSTTGPGDLSAWPQANGFAGLAAADEICREHARQADLAHSESFVAWLGTPGEDAAERLVVDAVFRRLDGFAVANSRADLLDGSVANSIHVDELGRYLSPSLFVWTGAFADGSSQTPNCHDWTSTVVGQTGAFGLASGARAPDWTQAGLADCSLWNRLYCISNAVAAEPTTLFDDGFELGSTAGWTATGQ